MELDTVQILVSLLTAAEVEQVHYAIFTRAQTAAPPGLESTGN